MVTHPPVYSPIFQLKMWFIMWPQNSLKEYLLFPERPLMDLNEMTVCDTECYIQRAQHKQTKFNKLPNYRILRHSCNKKMGRGILIKKKT